MGYDKRRHSRFNRPVRCPICDGSISAGLLDWHLDKYHSEDAPMALDGGDAAAQ